jgi:hypothetical protein
VALSAGGAWAPAVNTERGPVSHPQLVVDPVQGSEKGPVSHPQAVTDPQGPNTGQIAPPQTAPSPNSSTHAPKGNVQKVDEGQGK